MPAESSLPSGPLRSNELLGYCTNVHPGVDVTAIVDNLQTIATRVRQLTFAEEETTTATRARRLSLPMLPVGLWLPALAVQQLRRDGVAPLLKSLRKNHLLPYTLNGFPYDNFHQPVVKHAVYRPAWWNDERLAYTRDLAKILSELLPAETLLGSISTLPLGWPSRISESGETVAVSEEELHHAGTNLRRLAEDLRRLEERSGKRIVMAIEPEPGCLLATSAELIAWFDEQLPDTTHRRYIGVCHDVCHAAVMGERQADVLRAYAAAGILLAKVQISSAIVTDWQTIPTSNHAAALEQLSGFAEDRYLHQTSRLDANQTLHLSEDLPTMIAAAKSDATTFATDRRWITHFHVPVFLERFEHLTTTRDDVLALITALRELAGPPPYDWQAKPTKATGSAKPKLVFTGHFEVETYAWSVLPEAMRRNELAGDIASELRWVRQQLAASLA